MAILVHERHALLPESRHASTSDGASRKVEPPSRNHFDLSESPSLTTTAVVTSLYILSGCIQPLLMTTLRTAGLADPSCQIYMLAFYCGPASAIFMLWGKDKVSWPSKWTILKACGIAFWDISAQTLNYTGASMAGPAIFAIIYSSITIWAALFSQALLSRRMNKIQWAAVLVVFGGLAVTATDNGELGSSVIHGLIMILLGSSMHGLFYVMSEAIMTTGEERLSVEQNCAIQGLTATSALVLWQLVYTLPNAQQKLWEPMEYAGTSASIALALLVLFAAMSFLHSITLYHTLRYLSGGSTSAGVVEGLQAVLVFVLTHFLYCDRIGGPEMCFSTMKLVSLITVSGGVLGYGIATKQHSKQHTELHTSYKAAGYQGVEVDDEIEIEPI